MFNDIPETIQRTMRQLEASDRRDRRDGTERLQRLRQIGPETGRFLALLAACTPPGQWIEVGTSAGYSALWLALACRQMGRRLTTFEILPEKAKLATETVAAAAVGDVVDLIVGDALQHLPNLDDVAFCFLDAEKDVYADCYDVVIPRLVPGGILAADNATSHRAALQPMLDRALSDARVDACIVPIGKGVLLCRRIS